MTKILVLSDVHTEFVAQCWALPETLPDFDAPCAAPCLVDDGVGERLAERPKVLELVLALDSFPPAVSVVERRERRLGAICIFARA